LAIFDRRSMPPRQPADHGLFIFTLFPNEEDENAVSVGPLDGLVQAAATGRARVCRQACRDCGFVVETLELAVHEYHQQKPRMGLLGALRRVPRDRARAA
jgi:hypothetical protein